MSQSNTRCQSLITEERSSIDHWDAPGPHTARLGVGRKGGNVARNATELGLAPWVAAGKATAVGTSARARKLRPVARRALGDQERRSLPCGRVREAPDHSEAVAARSTDARWRGPRKKKGPKVQPRLRVGVRACWVHAGARASCSRARAREHECAGAGSRTRAARGGARRREGLG
jgi:hypothetical protein